jgi:hypothetical protein
MRKMAMTQDKVNRNIIKTIIGIVKSPLETPYWKVTKVPKAIKTFMLEPFSGKEGKFKKVKVSRP